MEAFIELAAILVLVAVVSLIIRILRQPFIVGYLITGILVGPQVFNFLTLRSEIEVLSKFGITILLFIVGLTLNPKVIREVGKVSLLLGVGQVVFTSVSGFGIALLLGIPHIAALYVAIGLTFSSTIIILKLLSDKGDLQKLYGKVAVGLLVIQDVVATIILLFLSTLNGAAGVGLGGFLGIFLLKTAGLFLLLFLFNDFILPKLIFFIAKSQELLFLTSLAWGLGLASFFYLLGFSAEIGALVAGVLLSMTPYAHEVGSRLKPLRDFFIVIFFILLGSQMQLTSIGSLLLPAVVLSLFVLIGNPFIVIILMNLLGFNRRVGFLAGLTVAQISEFSLILVTVGFNLGHLSRDVLSLITLVGLITITTSTYFILYNNKIYNWVQKWLIFLELRKNNSSKGIGAENFDIILFGFNRVGAEYVNVFKKLNKKYLVVDFNPGAISKLEKEFIPSRFGDAEDVEFLAELPVRNLKLVVSTLPDQNTNVLLINHIRAVNKKCLIVVISHDSKDACELYERGASYVIMPHYLGAQYAAHLISKLEFNSVEYQNEREKHLHYLTKRLTKE